MIGSRFIGYEDGVRLVLGAGVDSISHASQVRLDDGSVLSADLVLVVVGIQPQAEVLSDAGVPVESQRVLVDEHMRTRVPGLFAAGDVALAYQSRGGPAARRRADAVVRRLG